MSLTKHNYNFNGSHFECWVFQCDSKTWYRGSDVCNILGYTHTSRTLDRATSNPQWKKTCSELIKGIPKGSPLIFPKNWQFNAVFVYEPVVHKLIAISRKPQANQISQWIYEQVLPTLRKTGEYKLNKELAIKNTTIDQLTNALVESHKTIDALKQDVIHKPNNKQQLHSMVIFKISNKSLLCLRRQKRSMKVALKKIYKSYPSAEEIFSRDLIPNAMNTWSMLKDHVLQLDQDARCKFNRLFLKTIQVDEVLQVIHELI